MYDFYENYDFSPEKRKILFDIVKEEKKVFKFYFLIK